MRSPTAHEIARAKIAEEYYDLALRIAKSIAYQEYIHVDEITGPAIEGLMSAAENIVKRPEDIKDHKIYISAAIRNAISTFLVKESKKGLTGIEEGSKVPDILSLDSVVSASTEQKLEDIIPDDSQHFEQDFLNRDEIGKITRSLPPSYQDVIQIKAENPFASNAEIARRLGKTESAVKSVLYRFRKDFVK